MENIGIPYKDTGFFSKLITDYLDQSKSLSGFYNRFPTLDNFEDQIKEKSNSFSSDSRNILVKSLNHQYKNFELSTATQTNINSLAKATTYTITTGHQLNLFSGPLYFLYKIISVLKLCKQLKEKYPKQNFVPIYWMASEDHDFEEIKYFNFKGKKIAWDRESGGPVGRLSTNGLDMVFKEFSNVLNTGTNANQLRQLFKQAYLEHKNLADATRFLVNFLFGEYGLVVIDGDDKELKSLFKPYALKELKDKISFEQVSKTNESLKKQDYQIQVNPREINLFYIGNGFRERIIKENGVYKVNNTNLQFTNAEDLFANTDNLEFVSGNALLRPLYQEVILPNLCYIGGGGELAYWMQLKSTFNAFNIPFPMLLLRNSALLISEKQAKKIKKLDLEVHDLFLDTNELKKKLVNHHSEINFSFADKREKIYQTFKELRKVAEKTDKSFIGAVNAQEVKQLKGLDNLEKRLLKAEKKKLSNYMERLDVLHNSLFPKASLEERQRNMSEYYESYGVALINNLHLALNPLEFNFSVIFCENFT